MNFIEPGIGYASEAETFCPLPSRGPSSQRTSLTARNRHRTVGLGGKIGTVSGAGSRIGQVTATLLDERGAAVIISNINGLAAEFMACGLKERGMFAVTTTAEIDADPLARKWNLWGYIAAPDGA